MVDHKQQNYRDLQPGWWWWVNWQPDPRTNWNLRHHDEWQRKHIEWPLPRTKQYLRILLMLPIWTINIWNHHGLCQTWWAALFLYSVANSAEIWTTGKKQWWAICGSFFKRSHDLPPRQLTALSWRSPTNYSAGVSPAGFSTSLLTNCC